MNIFQAVIRPFQTQTSQNGMTNQQTAGAPDREEDGFLVVAETESERTTVYASDFTGDTPPDYTQVERERERDSISFYHKHKVKIKINFYL